MHLLVPLEPPAEPSRDDQTMLHDVAPPGRHHVQRVLGPNQLVDVAPLSTTAGQAAFPIGILRTALALGLAGTRPGTRPPRRARNTPPSRSAQHNPTQTTAIEAGGVAHPVVALDTDRVCRSHVAFDGFTHRNRTPAPCARAGPPPRRPGRASSRGGRTIRGSRTPGRGPSRPPLGSCPAPSGSAPRTRPPPSP